MFVIMTLLKYGMWHTSATKFLLILHILLLMEEFTQLPRVFNEIDTLCIIVEFLHIFCFLATAITIGLLVVSYRFYFFEDAYNTMRTIDKYWLHLITIIPTVSLIPFYFAVISKEDSVSDVGSDEWCTVETSSTILYLVAFAYMYSIVWVILLCSALILGYTMYQVYTLDEMVGQKLMSTTGMYSIVSILSYIPITYVRMAHFSDHSPNSDVWLVAFLPFYIAGIIYAMIFLTEKKSLILFERAIVENKELFSWESTSSRASNQSDDHSQMRSSPTEALLN